MDGSLVHAEDRAHKDLEIADPTKMWFGWFPGARGYGFMPDWEREELLRSASAAGRWSRRSGSKMHQSV